MSNETNIAKILRKYFNEELGKDAEYDIAKEIIEACVPVSNQTKCPTCEGEGIKATHISKDGITDNAGGWNCPTCNGTGLAPKMMSKE